MTTKTCTKCKRDLSLDHYTTKKGRPGQKSTPVSRCKQCVRKIHKEREYGKNRSKRKNLKSTTHKTCSDCGKQLSLSEFHPECKSPTKLWHYHSQCKSCSKAHAKKYPRLTRPSAKLLEHRVIESKRKLVRNGKFHTPHKSIDFTININDIRSIIQQQTHNGDILCAALGHPLSDRLGPLYPSLDRIDNSLGYIPGNIRLVSRFFNLARQQYDDITIISAMCGFEHSETQSSTNWLKPSRSASNHLSKNDIKSLINVAAKNGFRCQATNLPMTTDKGYPNSISLDRLSNTSYTIDNVRLVCRFYNLGRNKSSVQEADLAWTTISNMLSKNPVQIGNKHLFKDELQHGLFKPTTTNTYLRPQKCVIKLVNNGSAKSFLNKCHYIGSVDAKYHVAAIWQDQIVACLSIKSPLRPNSGNLEICRMARKPTIFIYGIWSYLFKWATANLPISGNLITFSDDRLFNGQVYEHMGFHNVGKVAPTYYYVKNGIRHHKSKLRKTTEERRSNQTERQLRAAQGYDRVWDKGKTKWSIFIQSQP